MQMKSKVLFGLILGLSLSAQAGKMQSFCYMNEDSKEIIGGQNVNEKLPLASVSKVLTTLNILSTVGAHTKLYTQFFATPVGNDLYDVHIKGSRDPYFARPSMHTLISRLNEMGVKKIRTLSFDQNFKYLYDTNKVNTARGKSYNPVTGKSDIDAPKAEFVKLLLLNKTEVLRDYQKSRVEAKANDVTLVAQPSYSPQKIEVLPDTFQPSEKAKKGFVSSMEMIDIIKYMNWNSNNHVANSLYVIAGGHDNAAHIFYDKFKLTPAEVSFENGSGQNADLTGNGRRYTSATCSAMVKSVRALRKNLQAQNMDLQDAIAVTGGDKGSTIDAAVYKRYLTPKTVIAKTGTVGIAITLAGLASSKNGKFYFMYSVEPRQAPGRLKPRAASNWRDNEAARCRAMIGQKLAERIALMDAGYPLSYELKNDREKRKFAETKKSSVHGLPIAYKDRIYDVINFEDVGDEDASELADAAPDVSESTVKAKVADKKAPSATPKYTTELNYSSVGG